MWLFKDHTKAIHIRIEPKKHRICGLFDADEIEMAITKFKATQQGEEHSEKNLVNTVAAV
jgi:hypothetical protein